MSRAKRCFAFCGRPLAVVAVSLVLAAGAPAMSLFAPPANARDEPANFVQWRPGLSSSAQPNALYLARAKAIGYDAVINLAPPQSYGSIATESAIVTGQGVGYLDIPVDFRRPTAEQFKVFVDEMKQRSGQNVLVHCQVNMRASAFVFLYRVIHENAPLDEAVGKLTGVWIPDRIWKKFIDDTLAAHGKKADIF